jgi:hypothetical protein
VPQSPRVQPSHIRSLKEWDRFHSNLLAAGMVSSEKLEVRSIREVK